MVYCCQACSTHMTEITVAVLMLLSLLLGSVYYVLVTRYAITLLTLHILMYNRAILSVYMHS
jgi:Flp pilus assembly protein protease CpaA